MGSNHKLSFYICVCLVITAAITVQLFASAPMRGQKLPSKLFRPADEPSDGILRRYGVTPPFLLPFATSQGRSRDLS